MDPLPLYVSFKPGPALLLILISATDFLRFSRDPTNTRTGPADLRLERADLEVFGAHQQLRVSVVVHVLARKKKARDLSMGWWRRRRYKLRYIYVSSSIAFGFSEWESSTLLKRLDSVRLENSTAPRKRPRSSHYRLKRGGARARWAWDWVSLLLFFFFLFFFFFFLFFFFF